jgi:hypothetical protein
MTPTMRPKGLGHGVYKDDIDFAVFSGDWAIGRIYERKAFSDAVRFFWSLHGVVLFRAPGVCTAGNAPTFEAAKAEFKKNWLRWLEWSEGASQMIRLEQRGAPCLHRRGRGGGGDPADQPCGAICSKRRTA